MKIKSIKDVGRIYVVTKQLRGTLFFTDNEGITHSKRKPTILKLVKKRSFLKILSALKMD